MIVKYLLLFCVVLLSSNVLVAQTPTTTEQEQGLAGNAEWRYLRTIGDNDAFGSIDDIEVVNGNRVAVADAMNSRVMLFSAGGELLSHFGQKGRGPGEFFRMVAIGSTPDGTLLVLDQGNMRISVLRIQGDSLHLSKEVRFTFPATGMCTIGPHVFLLGYHEGRLVHEFALDGTIVRSFYSIESEDRFDIALIANGRIACSEQSRLVAVASRMREQLEMFSLDGRPVRSATIPDYVETIYSRVGNSIRPETPPEGYAHETASLSWLDGTLIVQMRRIPPSEGIALETRQLSLDGGWAGAEPMWSRIGETYDRTIYTIENDPFPIVRVYRVQP